MADPDFDALARQYLADGYTGSVVARKLISQHGMSEDAATALVGALCGTSVDPRAGDTSATLVLGTVMMAVGAFIAWWCGDLILNHPTGGFRSDRPQVIGLALGVALAAAGLRKTFFALVNRNANEPLRRD